MMHTFEQPDRPFEGQSICRQVEGVKGCCVSTGNLMSSFLEFLACRRVNNVQESFTLASGSLDGHILI